MNLVEHGIFTEQCHLRAHVCVVAGKVYMYTPENGKKAIATGIFQTRRTYPKYAGYQATADGYIVPPSSIPFVQIYEVPLLIVSASFSPSDNPTIKGRKAENVVFTMAQLGFFCPPHNPEIVTDKERQYLGVDLIVCGAFGVQVKCDYNGGEHPQATGNLYLQTAERNIGFI